MRTLKLALASAIAAFAYGANAQVIGMGSPPTGVYQPPLAGIANSVSSDGIVFHAGGVAACDGCHVMHNANGGVAKSTVGAPGETPWSNRTNAYLLQGSDQSSTCLICHGSTTYNTNQFEVASLNVGAATPFFYSPAGDFGWVTKGYRNSPAERHGHNVVARDFGIVGDPTLHVAPGGTWAVPSSDPSQQFACSSCHDPHGRYRMQIGATPSGVVFAGPFAGSPQTLPIAATGSYGAAPTATYAVGAYRLLAGQRYAPASNSSYPFANDPPIAVAPMAYNRVETPTTEVRVAYGTGMSEWCQNCHVNVHLDGYSSGWAGLRHPAGSEAYLHAGQYTMYNTYVSSGNIQNTADNYTSLVPFEQGADRTIAQLLATASSSAHIAAGPTSNVMCLSCHRAHASAFDNMVRWDQNATFLTDGASVTAGITANASFGTGSARPAADTVAGYYGRNVGTGLGTYQRSLCNKCHGKD